MTDYSTTNVVVFCLADLIDWMLFQVASGRYVINFATQQGSIEQFCTMTERYPV
jgi:hypothetical protein